MERRTRGIPVARFRTQEAKTRSRSRVRDPDYNEQDPEHDMFTLLEDNIALREENKALKLEIETHKNQQSELNSSNEQLRTELTVLQTAHKELDAQVKELNVKQTKLQSERNASEKLRQMKAEEVKTLVLELDLLRRELQKNSTPAMPTPLLGSVELKRDLLKILPALGSNTNDMESILEVDDSLVGVHITSELVERLVAEFLTMKHSMNAVELQLYEANEKMSELLEHQHHLEEEIETLRTENTNLTKVAKLLTENMKESVETSKKMESALIKLKQRNDELSAAKAQQDHTDGQPEPIPSPTTLKANAEFAQIKEEVQQQARDHNERIVEMQSLMDAAIEKTTNDELKKLQLKLEILEEQLRQTVARAESAESALEKFKANEQLMPMPSTISAVAVPKPPPPPPPLPSKLLYQATLPPAEAAISIDFASHNLHKSSSGGGGNDGGRVGGGGVGDKIIDNVKQQVQAEAATGLDAIVREFKSGRVTLRRNRRKTRTNDALQEMFQVLELSQKQNRNSKICVNMHL